MRLYFVSHVFVFFFLSTYYIAVYKFYFLISNFRLVMNVVFLLSGNSPASEFCVEFSQHSVSSIFIGDEWTECILYLGDSTVFEFYVPTFRNTLSLFHLLRKWRCKTECVPKLRYIKFRRRGLTPQNIQQIFYLPVPTVFTFYLFTAE